MTESIPRHRWLGPLNKYLLQWFGVRLAARYERGATGRWRFVGWAVLRWVWPLTGWTSPYRWIARRGDVR